MWLAGIPRLPVSTYGSLVPWAGVNHRTYGNWAGDLAVGLGSRGPIGFHLLVGPGEGQWVQFAPLTRLCYHAKGANDWSFGIEVTGRNEDPFTDWQVRACAHIVRESSVGLGIPLTYYDSGRMGRRRGFVAHNAVAGSDHTDRWGDNWSRVLAAIGGDPVSEMLIPVPQAIRMNPDGSGRGLKMDLRGGMHPIGGQTLPVAPYWPESSWPASGGPVAVDFEVTDWSGVPKGYTLDCKGAVHAWQGTPPVASETYWDNSPWRVRI